ncbi:MAG: branched-chain amino acid aminotransferase [Alphaproteobacteria bacterium TMED93]|nr:MAG: branched-chain amino acid aminotransferase [Alphaproteobacteria bacterium TMED93]
MVNYADLKGYIFFDDELIEWNNAKLHVLSHGLHYASSVFEGERSYKKKVFKEHEHTNRLIHSAKTLGFELPYKSEEIFEIRKKVLEANQISDGYIRPVAWRGSEMMGISAQKNTIHFALAAWEWPSYFSPEAKLKGIKLNVSKWKRPDPSTAPVNTKAAGLYMICTLSKHEAESKGFDDSLMLDYRGYIAEATGANIFFVKDNEIHTPIADCFLDGITRQTIIKLAKEQGINVLEKRIKLEDLNSYQECFVTGTAAEVTPVNQIGDYTFIPGTMCKNLIEKYSLLTNNKI